MHAPLLGFLQYKVPVTLFSTAVLTRPTRTATTNGFGVHRVLQVTRAVVKAKVQTITSFTPLATPAVVAVTGAVDTPPTPRTSFWFAGNTTGAQRRLTVGTPPQGIIKLLVATSAVAHTLLTVPMTTARLARLLINHTHDILAHATRPTEQALTSAVHTHAGSITVLWTCALVAVQASPAGVAVTGCVDAQSTAVAICPASSGGAVEANEAWHAVAHSFDAGTVVSAVIGAALKLTTTAHPFLLTRAVALGANTVATAVKRALQLHILFRDLNRRQEGGHGSTTVVGQPALLAVAATSHTGAVAGAVGRQTHALAAVMATTTRITLALPGLARASIGAVVGAT